MQVEPIYIQLEPIYIDVVDGGEDDGTGSGNFTVTPYSGGGSDKNNGWVTDHLPYYAEDILVAKIVNDRFRL